MTKSDALTMFLLTFSGGLIGIAMAAIGFISLWHSLEFLKELAK